MASIEAAVSRRGDATDSYSELKERLLEQAYQEDIATEQVVQRRIETLTAKVRREVEAEHAEQEAARHSREDLVAVRETDVTARERQASPPYRAALVTAGALLALAGDLLIRLVA